MQSQIPVKQIHEIPVRPVEKPYSLKENSSLNIQCLNIETKVFQNYIFEPLFSLEFRPA